LVRNWSCASLTPTCCSKLWRAGPAGRRRPALA